LTTVVARVCLDMLRSRTSRREEPLSPDAPEPVATGTRGKITEIEVIGNPARLGELDGSMVEPSL
jgi:hypothetical protein